MNRRNFALSIMAIFALPKASFARDRSNNELVIKSGWILKKEDL